MTALLMSLIFPAVASCAEANGAAPAPASPLELSAGELVQGYRSSLVFIEGSGGGAGSGFICRTKDGAFLFTNQHVVAGIPGLRFTRLDNSVIATGAVGAAVGHDLMRFACAEPARPLIASENVAADTRIGGSNSVTISFVAI